MEKPWSPTQPLCELWEQLQTAQEIAEDAEDPISERQAMASALRNLEKAGVLEDAIRDWHKKPTADWNINNFENHFDRADKERRQKATIGSEGYSANKAEAEKENKAEPKPNERYTDKYSPTGWHFCWSHGLGTNPKHTSATCTSCLEGHQKAATFENMMGGCVQIQRISNDKPHSHFSYKGRKDFCMGEQQEK